MGYFNSWRIHYDVGWVAGLSLRTAPVALQHEAIKKLDVWAHKRERRQHVESGNPEDVPISEHKLREAMAWGAGARAAVGIEVPYPSPPYPLGRIWSGTDKRP